MSQPHDPMTGDGDSAGFTARHIPGVDKDSLREQAAVDGIANLDKLRGSLSERPININSFAKNACRLAGLYHLRSPHGVSAPTTEEFDSAPRNGFIALGPLAWARMWHTAGRPSTIAPDCPPASVITAR